MSCLGRCALDAKQFTLGAEVIGDVGILVPELVRTFRTSASTGNGT
jgi:hypothetical protein